MKCIFTPLFCSIFILVDYQTWQDILKLYLYQSLKAALFSFPNILKQNFKQFQSDFCHSLSGCQLVKQLRRKKIIEFFVVYLFYFFDRHFPLHFYRYKHQNNLLKLNKAFLERWIKKLVTYRNLYFLLLGLCKHFYKIWPIFFENIPAACTSFEMFSEAIMNCYPNFLLTYIFAVLYQIAATNNDLRAWKVSRKILFQRTTEKLHSQK